MMENFLRLIADQEELCQSDDELSRIIQSELADMQEGFLDEDDLEYIQAARKDPDMPNHPDQP